MLIASDLLDTAITNTDCMFFKPDFNLQSYTTYCIVFLLQLLAHRKIGHCGIFGDNCV